MPRQFCSCGDCGVCLSRRYLQAWTAGAVDAFYASLTDEQMATLSARRAAVGRKVDAKRAGTPKRSASLARSSVRQRERNPEKYKARTALNNAIRDGRAFKEPCQVCGAEKVEAHHPDYSKPLEVLWFCRPHHKAHHGHLRPDYPL